MCPFGGVLKIYGELSVAQEGRQKPRKQILCVLQRITSWVSLDYVNIGAEGAFCSRMSFIVVCFLFNIYQKTASLVGIQSCFLG